MNERTGGVGSSGSRTSVCGSVKGLQRQSSKDWSSEQEEGRKLL